jgi:non-lysosomal glucosylceramidase
LLLCSWPKGGRPKLPFPYSDEVWTGIEFQVAAHMIYAGLLDEGLAIVKGVADRYDGLRRNPWNEVECGSHYARAMASWSVLMALSGYGYSAEQHRISFAPLLTPENFRCFFSAGSGWGAYNQQIHGSSLVVRLEVHHGQLPLRYLTLNNQTGASLVMAQITGPGGKPLTGHKLEAKGKDLVVDLGETVTIAAGDALQVTLSGARQNAA